METSQPTNVKSVVAVKTTNGVTILVSGDSEFVDVISGKSIKGKLGKCRKLEYLDFGNNGGEFQERKVNFKSRRRH